MSGLIWPDVATGWYSFLLLILLGAAAAYSSGSAFAQTWSSRALIIPATLALSLFVQFLHFALYEEDLLSLHYWLVNWIVLLAVGALGYSVMRSRQMSTQYSWAFQSRGITWTAK